MVMVRYHPTSLLFGQPVTHVAICTHIRPCHLHRIFPSYVALGGLAIAYSGSHCAGHALMLGLIYNSIRLSRYHGPVICTHGNLYQHATCLRYGHFFKPVCIPLWIGGGRARHNGCEETGRPDVTVRVSQRLGSLGRH